MLHHAEDGAAVVHRIRTGELSCSELADAVLAAIGGDQINAWECISADSLLEQATALDRLDPARREQLPLLGLPIGLKDNFDTAGLPTGYGSPMYREHRPDRDAEAVRRLRAAGAMIVGKTKLAEFAWLHPPDTLNPLDRTRTPGGSSSGSAAAVAAGMVPVATGTQTAGSINRPASYTGIVGYKPTFGLIPRDGVKLLAGSLDTVGVLARSVRDAATVAAVLAGAPNVLAHPLAPTPSRDERSRLAFARTAIWDRVEPAAQRAIDDAVAAIEGMEEIALPSMFSDLIDAQTTIQSYEAALSLAPELERSPEVLSDELRAELSEGASIGEDRYAKSLALRERAAPTLLQMLSQYDGVVVPSTTGIPPVGLESTGDPVFCRVWTLIGAPTVSLPLAWTEDSLPVGLLLAGAPGGDERTLATAARLLPE
jgi:Asp-tRNA(Asn)/Glu-tRNA(Gln) amidotransferase A subunit family amidase